MSWVRSTTRICWTRPNCTHTARNYFSLTNQGLYMYLYNHKFPTCYRKDFFWSISQMLHAFYCFVIVHLLVLARGGSQLKATTTELERKSSVRSFSFSKNSTILFEGTRTNNGGCIYCYHLMDSTVIIRCFIKFLQCPNSISNYLGLGWMRAT